ncbi:MAG: YigZ family protein [Bacteroidia bacterium]|nr:YigZ family protein [Bacteroidia bacterium]NND52201.1 YigZ family protein [Flavobacteriaceae bacterium]
MDLTDQYYTIDKPSAEVLFKEKGSKFFGYAFPLQNEDDVKSHIEDLKKMHHSARHWCYAYQLGTETITYRANDDGEPTHSAGQPIYGQIQSFNLTNVLIVVVRYFGGTKLGVGGLITAYKTCAKMAIESSRIISRSIDECFVLNFKYKDMNKVMRIIKEKNIRIANQKMELDCSLEIHVRKSEAEAMSKLFEQLYGVSVKKL